MFDDFPLGENQTQAPQIQTEVHRYPFDSNAGTSARIYEHYSDATDVTGGFGYPVKDSLGKIYVVSDEHIKKYDKDLTTAESTIDITALQISFVRGVDMIETGTNRYIYIAYDRTGHANDVYIAKLKLNVHRTNDTLSGSWIGDVFFPDETATRVVNTFVGTFATIRAFQIEHNNDNSYLIIGTNDDVRRVYKYGWSDYASLTASYVLTTVSDSTSGTGFSVTDDYVFVHTGSNLHSFDTATLTEIDQIALSGHTGTVSRASIAPLAGDEYVIINYSGTSSYLNIYGFDKTTGGSLAKREEIEISTLWENAPGFSLNGAGTHAWNGKDGTLLIGYQDTSDTFHAVQHLIMDLNPAQALYDIIVNEMSIATTDVNTSSLQTLSNYCRDNRIGISAGINTEEKALNLLSNLLSYCHSIMYMNNDGQYTFKPFQDTDASQATITETDIVAGEFNKINVAIKDKAQCANRVNVEYLDRLTNYHKATIQADHFLAQEEDNQIVTENVQYIWLSNPEIAIRQTYRLLKFAQYDTKVLTFDLLPKHLDLNVGDVITLDISSENLNSQKVRILQIDDPILNQSGALTVTARIEESYLNSFENYTKQKSEMDSRQIDMPTPVTPVVFERPALKTGDEYRLGMAAIKFDNNVDKCKIFVSEDDTTYKEIGELTNFAVVGDVSEAATSDAVTIKVNTAEYPSTFSGYTVEEQRNDVSACMCGTLQSLNAQLINEEMLSFREIVTDGDDVTLRNCYRGKYHYVPQAHAVSDVIVQIGIDQFFDYKYISSKVGKKIYIKAPAINIRGDAEALADVDTYEYTIRGDSRNSTHVSGLQIWDNSELRGSLYSVDDSEVTVKWRETNRVGGIDHVAYGQWEYNSFVTGDNTGYNVIIYNSSKAFVATHVLSTVVTEYTYTSAQNITDFGSLTKNFFIGIEPINPQSAVSDIVRIPIILNV